MIKALGPGGAEQLLLSAARTHDHSSFDIECAFLIEDDPSFVRDMEAAGVRCHLLTAGRGPHLWPYRLRALIAGGNFDVVHVHSPLPGSVARLSAATIARKSRPVLMTTEHCIWGSYHAATRALNRLTIRRDAAVFAVSDETLESIEGPAARRSTTLLHGIDVDAVAAERANREQVREELGIRPGEWVIGTVANFREQKDYPNLLEAVRLLAQRGCPVRCVSVGHGPLETEMRRLAGTLAIADRVIFLGRRRDATRIMSAFDIFTLASQWEGLPVALMEALAIGLPIVATRVGGVDEAVGTEEFVTLVSPRDPEALAVAFESVFADESHRTAMTDRSRQLAERFDIRRAVATIEQTYRRVSGGSLQ